MLTVATNLLKQIEERVKISDKATSEEAKAGESDDKWMTPSKTKEAIYENAGSVNVDGSIGKFMFGGEIIMPKEAKFLSANLFSAPASSGNFYDMRDNIAELENYLVGVYYLSPNKLTGSSASANLCIIYIKDDGTVTIDETNIKANDSGNFHIKPCVGTNKAILTTIPSSSGNHRVYLIDAETKSYEQIYSASNTNKIIASKTHAVIFNNGTSATTNSITVIDLLSPSFSNVIYNITTNLSSSYTQIYPRAIKDDYVVLSTTTSVYVYKIGESVATNVGSMTGGNGFNIYWDDTENKFIAICISTGNDNPPLRIYKFNKDGSEFELYDEKSPSDIKGTPPRNYPRDWTIKKEGNTVYIVSGCLSGWNDNNDVITGVCSYDYKQKDTTFHDAFFSMMAPITRITSNISDGKIIFAIGVPKEFSSSTSGGYSTFGGQGAMAFILYDINTDTYQILATPQVVMQVAASDGRSAIYNGLRCVLYKNIAIVNTSQLGPSAGSGLGETIWPGGPVYIYDISTKYTPGASIT